MTKRSSSKPPDPVRYFVDRDLGPTDGCEFIRTIRNSGMLVEAHGSHFAADADDPVWLGALAKNGWVGITKDSAIQFSQLAVDTLMLSGSKLFICIGTWTHEKLAQNVANSRHKLDQFVRRSHDPFIARLYMATDHRFERGKGGDIKMWRTYAEWLALRGGSSTS